METHISIHGELAERVAEQLHKVGRAYQDADKEFIRVYRFKDAPVELRELSRNGGDEDWLAILPPEYEERHYITWLEEGTPFGVCSVEKHTLIDGTTIYIGSHA